VSYDGALDALGVSQVVPYLLGLAAEGAELSLITFEKEERWRERERRGALTLRLRAAGITWRPLRYHRRPRLPATAWDVARGARALRAEVRRTRATLVHCRAEVAMVMARLARLPPGVRVLHDMRALFSAERVASSSWAAGGALDRWVRRAEEANLRRADALVTLTERGHAQVAPHLRPGVPTAVIPTCVDLEAFTPRPPGVPAAYGIAYSGSLGALYLAREMVDFARAFSTRTGSRALFMTPQPEVARAAGLDASWADVGAEAPAAVPARLRTARAVLFFLREYAGAAAACPTKFAEALACGLPVVCTRGIGDLDRLLAEERIGVLLDGFTPAAVAAGQDALLALLAEPDLAARCRGVAERRFGLAQGVAAYHRLYRELGRDVR
jgi:glycosyltransferase involved in cell wall biosynthesis